MFSSKLSFPWRRPRAGLLALAAVCFAASAKADSVTLFDASRPNSNRTPVGWELNVKDGTARLIAISDESTQGVCLDAVSSSFSIQREAKIDLERYPLVSWRWRANMLPLAGDFRKRNTDDQAAQLFILSGRRAINYIWDTNRSSRRQALSFANVDDSHAGCARGLPPLLWQSKSPP
jgi:hypothetical protein